MKAKDPLYYNSLADKHTTKYVEKPAVKKHLHTMGLTAVDGTVYPTREEQFEANRINRLYEERQDMLCKLVMREQSHLCHLRRSARAGELMFTKNGVFETNPCDDCHIYHKVTSYLHAHPPLWGEDKRRNEKPRWVSWTDLFYCTLYRFFITIISLEFNQYYFSASSHPETKKLCIRPNLLFEKCLCSHTEDGPCYHPDSQERASKLVDLHISQEYS